MTAHIILLNGVGSAGKTSIAQALQTITADPFLHVGIDTFIEMMPPSSFGTPDGLTFAFTEEDGKPSAVITSGPFAQRVFRGKRLALAALADAGNDLILDEVIWDDELAEYQTLFARHDLKLVGVFAPLEVLEAREIARGDRAIGLARWQFSRVHAGRTYDLEVDTSKASPLECATLIRDRFRL